MPRTEVRLGEGNVTAAGRSVPHRESNGETPTTCRCWPVTRTRPV